MTEDVDYIQRIKQDNEGMNEIRFKIAKLGDLKPGWWWSKTDPGGTKIEFKGFAEDWTPDHPPHYSLYFTEANSKPDKAKMSSSDNNTKLMAKRRAHWRNWKPDKNIDQALEIIQRAYPNDWVLKSNRCVIQDEFSYEATEFSRTIVGAMLKTSGNDYLIEVLENSKQIQI